MEVEPDESSLICARPLSKQNFKETWRVLRMALVLDFASSPIAYALRARTL